MPTVKQQCKLPRRTIIRVAGLSECDPRTVENYLSGKSVRPASARAIENALRALVNPQVSP